MDSLLSLHTPNNNNNNFHIPTTTSTTTTTTSSTTASPGGALKVPKPEPFDEFLTPHHDSEVEEDDAEKQLQLYSDFCRVSNLFREAFGKTLHQQFGSDDDFHYDLDSHLVDVKVSVSDPILENGFDDLNFPVLNSNHVDPNAGAIVAVSSPQGQAVEVTTTPRRKPNRMKELMRAMDLGVKDQVHFREVVRKTRMVYESIRVVTSIEDEKRVAAAVEEKKRVIAAMAAAGSGEIEGSGSKSYRRPRLRGDLRAASLMRDQGLWLNRDKRIVGAIPGIDVGDVFLFRMELCVLGLHGQIQAGIDYLPGSMSSNGEPIATSVIVSGGYEDDLDDGEVIVYTGQGGQEKNSYRHASHQKLEGGNLALERSMHYGIEVRVIRGVRYEGSASSSGKVYVYDGLYKIVDCWFDVGRSGFGVYKYKLRRIEGQEKMGSAILKEARDVRRSGIDFNPMHCLSVDISNSKENFPVRLFNDIDDNRDPLCFEYITKTTFPQFVFHQSGKATGCDCVDGCAHDCFCFMKNGSEFPYNQHGRLVRGKPLIFECGPFCRCPPHCRNRVTQKGPKNRLEVFRSTQTGWGVRSLDLIHAGAFICEYAGVILTREQAQILTMNGCDSSIHPNQFSKRWAEWGDISQIYSDYVRPSHPSVPPLDFSLDVSTMRNIACYMSHSSTPNVFVQFVLYDHNNLMFPHIMIFALENIPPMRELSLDYGVADECTGKLSICN
ncbi:hypothetical protein TanjilG_03765 [Lupinus angustifolius]|uniref:SET domain-containing protein n=1 Tax=Lupinus angustifolius TaxID=3871 RepID=A0A1J7H0B0_LUPAN|nr:hypothetical protein TanjilG_03765 [Lupinus angustifolius]